MVLNSRREILKILKGDEGACRWKQNVREENVSRQSSEEAAAFHQQKKEAKAADGAAVGN